MTSSGDCTIQYLFILLLVICTDCAESNVTYYISSSLNTCVQDPCITLSQFATNSSKHQGNETNISLIFLPGNHTLDTELILTQIYNFFLTKYSQDNGNVFIKCISQSGRFNIINTTTVSIEHVHFIGCGQNRVAHVQQFLLQDATFHGVQSRGRALGLKNITSALIVSTKFSHGSDEVDNRCGGVMHVSQSLIYIINSIFSENNASCGGVLAVTNNSSFVIINSTFNNNHAEHYGTIFTLNCTFIISNSTFMNNSARQESGVLLTIRSVFRIISSSFVHNTANNNGVIGAVSNSRFIIENSSFANNSATASSGGVIATYNSLFFISASQFTNNSANFSGGVIITYNSLFSIRVSNFTHNGASKGGGVIVALFWSSINITDCIFTNNSVTFDGGEGGGNLYVQSSYYKSAATTVNISGSVFRYNKAYFGGIMFVSGCSVIIASSNFSYNLGSLTAYSSNVTFRGHNRFEHQGEQMEPKVFEVSLQQGGAVTGFKSNIIFTGECDLSNNQAIHGGALRAIESTVRIYGKTLIANNRVTSRDGAGGGINLQQSFFDIKGNCTIYNNHAVKGGGIYTKGSTVTAYKPGFIQIISNNASNGGGVYLEADSYLSTLHTYSSTERLFTFIDNHANYGGALYVADHTNSASCSLPSPRCFFQSLGFDEATDVSVLFSENTAINAGPSLFGGLLDRCIVQYAGGFVEVLPQPISGISYLKHVSNISLDSVHSFPVQVCFCTSDEVVNCSYQPPTFRVKRGERFTFSVVALDQVNHPVNSSIITFLSFPNGGFDEGQQIQMANSKCTDLAFTVFSPEDNEKITLYADGPCGSSSLSVRSVDIEFLNCTCWIGFEPSNRSPTRCECICNSTLSPHITQCNYTTKSLLRDTNS